MLKIGEPLKADRFSVRIYGVLRRGDEVLLTRSRFRQLEFVNFPGGGVELGEAPIESLRREFHEETGLAIHPVRVLYANESAHPSSAQPIQIVSIYWLVESLGGEPKKGSDGEVVDLFWSDYREVSTAEMFPADAEFVAKLPSLL